MIDSFLGKTLKTEIRILKYWFIIGFLIDDFGVLMKYQEVFFKICSFAVNNFN